MEDSIGISKELRAETARQNLKYVHLAQKLGISRQAVSQKMRNNHADYSVKELKRYADVLNTPAWVLLRRAEQATKKPRSEEMTTDRTLLR